MSEQVLRIHYVTDDCHNVRDFAEIDALRVVGSVDIVTTNPRAQRTGLSALILPKNCVPEVVRRIWPRLCFLLAQVPASTINQKFPQRNIYSSPLLGRALMPIWWQIKMSRLGAFLLPTYTSLYYLPSRILAAMRFRQVVYRELPKADVVVYDATLARMPKFACYLHHQRRAGAFMVANVKSWDNPFTASLDTSADCYLVWSESMWQDITRTHGKLNARHVAWGALPFDTFKRAAAHRPWVPPRASKERPFTIGYASAYPCAPMDAHEETVVAEFMTRIRKIMPDTRLLWRPYPTKPGFTTPLPQAAGIELSHIEGTSVDRYGDGSESITFSTDAQKIDYLAQCDCFLSIGTSFTLEAAIAGTPIFQFNLDRPLRKTEAEKSLFGWIDISDHLQAYYITHLPVHRDYDALVEAVCKLKNRQLQPEPGANALLKSLGIHTQMSADERGRALARQSLDGQGSRCQRARHDV
jgi:hypothetical protein